MGERKFLQVITFKHWESGREFQTRTHFKTSENAIKDANQWITRKCKMVHRDVLKVDVISKDTKEVVWSWEA